VFRALLESFDPTIIVADGMTVLYGLHGHDTNEATATEVITGWLKSLCRNGHSTVIVIDHTGKGGGAGSSPIGAHHKVAMVQGSSLRVDVVERPMPGARGEVRLIVYKDRPGAVRAISSKAQEQVAGVVVLDSTRKDVTVMHIEPPDPNDVVVANSEAMERELVALGRQERLREQVMGLFGGDVDLSFSTKEVVEKLDLDAIGKKDLAAVWTHLIKSNVILMEGVSRWAKYRLKP
jgi:hypothetical protein